MKTLNVILVLALSGTALADRPGRVVKLGPAEQKVLQSEVARARVETPAAFAALARVSGYQPRSYLKTRLRKPLVGPELRALGKDGLLPMLAALAETGMPGASESLSADERAALEAGLLVAVGDLGDARALPVLRAAFQQGTQAHVISAAALGLGRLCTDDALAALSPALDLGQRGGRGLSALAGLGECRKASVVARLARLVATLAPAEQAVAVTSLGRVAGSWALAAEVASGKLTRAEADAMAKAALTALTALSPTEPHVAAARRLAIAAVTDNPL